LDVHWGAVARGYRVSLLISGVLAVLALVVCALVGKWEAGVFIVVGLGLGLWNSRRLWADTLKLTDGTAEAGESWRGPAVGATARRLGLITLIGILVAIAFQPLGWTVFLGLLAFQLLLMAVVLPSLRKVSQS
jgi:hypothetical protein